MKLFHLNLIRKIFHDRSVSFAASTVLLFAFGWINTWVVFAMNDGDLLSMFMKQAPRFLQATIGIDGLVSLSNLHLLMLGLAHPLPLAVIFSFSIGLSSAGLAGEIERGTIELILTRSITRTQFVLSHIIFLGVGLAFLVSALYIGSRSGARYFQLPFPTAIFGRAIFSYFCLHFAFSGLLLAISALSSDRSRVMAIGLGFVVLEFFLDFFARAIPVLSDLKVVTLFSCHSPLELILKPELKSWAIAILLGVGTLGYGFSLWYFNRRDLVK